MPLVLTENNNFQTGPVKFIFTSNEDFVISVTLKPYSSMPPTINIILRSNDDSDEYEKFFSELKQSLTTEKIPYEINKRENIFALEWTNDNAARIHPILQSFGIENVDFLKELIIFKPNIDHEFKQLHKEKDIEACHEFARYHGNYALRKLGEYFEGLGEMHRKDAMQAYLNMESDHGKDYQIAKSKIINTLEQKFVNNDVGGAFVFAGIFGNHDHIIKPLLNEIIIKEIANKLALKNEEMDIDWIFKTVEKLISENKTKKISMPYIWHKIALILRDKNLFNDALRAFENISPKDNAKVYADAQIESAMLIQGNLMAIASTPQVESSISLPTEGNKDNKHWMSARLIQLLEQALKCASNAMVYADDIIVPLDTVSKNDNEILSESKSEVSHPQLTLADIIYNSLMDSGYTVDAPSRSMVQHLTMMLFTQLTNEMGMPDWKIESEITPHNVELLIEMAKKLAEINKMMNHKDDEILKLSKENEALKKRK